jgi:hypothetical protein
MALQNASMEFLIIFWNIHNKILFKNYIKMDLREMGLEGVDWYHLAQDRDRWWALVNMLMNLWAP